jgi:predicted Zn finger-like uncharacterized protein
MNVSCPECRTVFRLDPAKITSVSMRARCSVCGGLIPVGAAVSWGDELPTVPAPTPAVAGAGSSPNVRSIGSRPKTPLQSGATAWPPPVPRNPLASPSPSASSKTATPNQPAAAPPPPPVRQRTPPFSPKFTPTLQRAAPDEKRSAKAAGPASRAVEETPTAPGATFGAPLTPPSRTSIPEPTASPPPSAPRSPTPSPLPTGGSVSAAFSTPSTPASGPAAIQRKPINPFLANDPNQKARRLARALVSDMVAYHPTKREEGIQAGTLKHLFREEIRKSYEEYVEQVGRDFAESTMHFQEALNDVLAGGRKIF